MSQIDIDGAGGVTDHGALTGLADDDHTQYALVTGRQGDDLLIRGITGLVDIRKLSLVFDGIEQAYFNHDPDTNLTTISSKNTTFVVRAGTREWDFTPEGLHLFPYITTAQRDAAPQTDGEMIFNNTAGQFQSREAGVWNSFGFSQSYAPGSFTIKTEKYAIMSRHLKLTGTNRATLEGTATLRIT